MLRIRPEQLEHFAERTRKRFVQMMVDYLRESFGERVASLGAEPLAAWVRSGLDLCERAGVTTEPEAAQLILLLLVLAPPPAADAEQQHEWVRELIARRGLSPEGKVRLMVQAARRERLPIDEVVVYPQFEEASTEVASAES